MCAGTVRPRTHAAFESASKLAAYAPKKFATDFTGGIPRELVKKSWLAATVRSGVFVVEGTTDGTRRYIWNEPLDTDDQIITGELRSPAGQVMCVLMGRSDAANDNSIFLGVSQNSTAIARAHGNGEQTTVLAQSTRGGVDGERWRLKVTGNLFEGQVESGGTWVTEISHVDSGETPIGPNNRYVGVEVFRNFFVNSGGWDSWSAQDQIGDQL
ncbi:hypothetical protein ACWCW7_17655 [Nocardia tengchongensis]